MLHNSTNNSGTASVLASVNAERSQSGGFTHSGLANASQHFYWLAAVDTSGNVSALSGGVNATTLDAQGGGIETVSEPADDGE